MKVVSIKQVTSKKPVKVLDCYVDNGYVKAHHGSLADVDVDYQGDRRHEVKEYLERRYNHDGKQRVFSAGTFTTERARSVIKDVARTHKISVSTTNYITAIIEDNSSWTDLMVLAFESKKVRDYLQKYWQVFEEIYSIMFQPRSAGVHASAVITVPDTIKGRDVECFDIVPIRKMDGLLVSEIDGYSLDDMGLLKNDCLSIAELSRISEIINLCNEHYQADLSLLKILHGDLNEKRVYDAIQKGLTQGVFQMSGDGITRFIKQMKPSNINDLIALVALFRPGPLDSGSAQGYVDCKNGNVEPEFLWGTYEVLKDTFGFCIYQEDISKIAQKIGNLSLSEGVNLVKALSKKKLEKVRVFKDKYFEGSRDNGCPKEVAERIWQVVEDAAKYAFNKCISGKEYIMRPNKHEAVTVEEMYHIMNDCAWSKAHNKMPLRSRYLKHGYGTAWSLDYDGKLRKNRIVDIRYEGKRPLYRITLENGKTIDVTDNHRHPTSNGTRRTDELRPGIDKMFCYLGHKKRDTEYRFSDKGKLNNLNYHSNDKIEHYELNSKKGREGFYSRDTNYTKLQYYCDNLKKDYCEVCGKSDGRLEVHHINGDHSDCGKNYSNLQTLCPSCHKKAHYKMGRVKMGESGVDTLFSTVVSIECIGEGDVYDVEMEAPLHTFVNGNGVVTHNSHAAAYGLTGYIGAWLKVHYPIAFYTVLLKWVEKEKLPTLMNEMREIGNATIVQPDINISSIDFVTDFQTNEIYWSLSRIRNIGAAQAKYIFKDRAMYGEYKSLEHFIKRIFRARFVGNVSEELSESATYGRCPVTSLSVKHLILSGAFDKVEGISSVMERYGLIKKMADMLMLKDIDRQFPEDLVGKHYFWSQKQIDISGFGSIDYKRIYNNMDKPQLLKKYRYCDLNEFNTEIPEKFTAVVCATIAEVSEKTYKDKRTGETKRFGKVMLQQNTDMAQLVVWNEAWMDCKRHFVDKCGNIVVAVVQVKYSDYDEKNILQINKGSFVGNV